MGEGGYIIIRLVIMVVCGAAAAAIASNKGRSGFGWFWGGFLLGIIGLIIVAVLPNLNKQKRVQEQGELERRRLREQLLQERMKSEAFRSHVTNRLDAHDEALGMETRALGGGVTQTAGQLTAGTDDPGNPVVNRLVSGEAQSDAGAFHQSAEWYYVAAGVTHGPFALDEVAQRFRMGELGAQTLIWTAALGKWTPAGDVPQLRGELA